MARASRSEHHGAATSARLLQLLVLLQRRPSWTGVELAVRLGVNITTVRRDVDRVRGLGYTVESTPGASGGYRLGIGTGYAAAASRRGGGHGVAVLLGVSAGAALPGIERAALATLARVERLLPKRLQHQVQSLRSAALLLVRPTEPVPVAELAPLAEACAERQLVSFDYVSRNGQPSSRRAEPYRLVATTSRWYLVAFDLDRKDWRTFRIDRLKNLVISGHVFAPRPLHDPEQLVRDALSSTSYRYRAEVRVAAPSEELSRRIAPNVGIVEPQGGARCFGSVPTA